MLITWGAGLGLVGPFAIPLTALTRREEFITVPAAIIARFGMWLGGVKVTIHGRERINPSDVVNTLTNIGAVYSEQGDFALAEERLAASAAHFREAGELVGAGSRP